MTEKDCNNKKSSLYFFIEENHNLFSVMGVFAALALFSQSYPGSLPGLFISFLFVTCFVILILELWSRFEKDTPADELLFWFQRLLFLAGFAIVFYWLLGLRLIDKDFFYQVVSLGLSMVLISLTTRIIRERDYISTRWWRWLRKHKLLKPILLVLSVLITYCVWVAVHGYLSPVMEPVFSFLWLMKTAVIKPI